MRRVISSVWMRRWCAFVRSGAARQRVAYAGNAQRLTNRADGMADRHLCDCVHAAVTGTVLSLIATGMRRAVEHKSARWPPAHALSLARKPSENADKISLHTKSIQLSPTTQTSSSLYTPSGRCLTRSAAPRQLRTQRDNEHGPCGRHVVMRGLHAHYRRDVCAGRFQHRMAASCAPAARSAARSLNHAWLHANKLASSGCSRSTAFVYSRITSSIDDGTQIWSVELTGGGTNTRGKNEEWQSASKRGKILRTRRGIV